MFNEIAASIDAHPTTWALGVAYVATAAINALPEPGVNLPFGSLIYHWLFDFLHTLSNRVSKRYPELDSVKPKPTPPPTAVTVSTSQPVVVQQK